MLRTAIVGLTALMITMPTLARSQEPATGGMQAAPDQENDTDWKAMTDARIDVLKSALQLTPDQEKLWPAVEAAIKARADARRARIANLAKMRDERPDFFEMMRDRADNMAQRAAGLKQLADAWQPLYKTLDDKQKTRLRVMAMYIMHEVHGAIQNRMQYQDDGDYGGEE